VRTLELVDHQGLWLEGSPQGRRLPRERRRSCPR
jgi:hypothetical protein